MSSRAYSHAAALVALDAEQREIVDYLTVHGPTTAAEIADALYPSGRRYREDWDLAPESKVEMELRRAARVFAVEVVGERSDPKLGGLDEVWSVTSPERAAELRTANRRVCAEWIIRCRREERHSRPVRSRTDNGGPLSFAERVAWRMYREERAERRRWSKLTAAEKVREFNQELAQTQERMAVALAELRRAVRPDPLGPSGPHRGYTNEQ